MKAEQREEVMGEVSFTPELSAKLLSFFQWAAEGFWDEGACEINGGDFQDKAEALGLIVEVPYDPAEHGSFGADEYGLSPGDSWFVYSAEMKAALSKATQKGEG